MKIQKTYEYKVYSSLGSYLGKLNNVTSDFGYNQTIATVGAQIQIDIAQSSDIAGLKVDPIFGEDGNALMDENGNNLLIERQPEVVGSSNPNILIQNNNQVQVYEYSDYYPNGLLVFTGYIAKWKTKYGGDEKITITCISNGQDLSNYIVQTGDTSSVAQTTDNGTVYSLISTAMGGNKYQAQNFVASSTIQVGGVSVELTTVEPGTLSISVYNGTLALNTIISGSSIASGNVHVGTLSTKTAEKVTFNNPSTLTSGQPYFFLVIWQPDNSSSSAAANIYANSTNPYASGDSCEVSSPGPYYQVSAMHTGVDLYFNIWAHGTSTVAPYVSQDPTFILTDVMNNYISAGGQAKIPSVNVNSLVSSQLNDASLPNGSFGTAYAQIFTPAKALTVNLIQFLMGVSTGFQNVTVQIVKGDPSLDSASTISGMYTYSINASNTVIATSNVTKIANVSPAVISFSFGTPVNLISGQQYYLLVQPSNFVNTITTKGGSSGEVPADTQVGRVYISASTVNNSSAGPSLNASYPYMFFNLAYLNPIPANLAGGYLNTGITTTYTFKLQTVLQAIQTIYSLSPVNWYWYVDPSDNTLYWAQSNTTADITVIRGKHINDLEIEATKENIKNVVYFAGGDDGTGTQTNILVKRTAAIGNNRIGLGTISDNRVNSTTGGVTTAKLIGDEYLNDNASETYITNITLQDSQMDTNKIKLGMMVGFSGFGNFVESLLLQVVGIQRTPDQAILQLGTLPVRASLSVAQIQAQLAYLQTVNTTTTPS